ncbi:hypothetical protein B7P43_G04695 [Cryptotermes secundus]|uniref:Uncharacterized protein n=1 Tax=Cryptotermes secundus TaxID=105785 RepID=A0A2J7QFD3_9NEOP|nr:uncharacterized protein LOC111867907 isoform X2 [Cryptotermes secundus]PNF27288.1 hypothetical protein B7P43_G04695 [Cryptotermes secundus]
MTNVEAVFSRMEESEQFLDQIHCQLSASGMNMDRETLKDYLLVPGEGRLMLIHWALSELNIVVNKHDITEVVIECGLCLPSNSNTVLGKCSAKDNFEFWKRLFHMVRMYQEAKPAQSASMYRNVCKFWLELAANPELKDVLQPKRKDILPIKLPKNSAKNISVEKILKEKLLEERKLRELQKEAETYQQSEDKEKYCNIGAHDAEELDKLKHHVHIFKHYMANFLMPWILDTPQNSELDKYNEVIPELASKVEKVREICNNAAKISAALEELPNIKLEEPLGEERLGLPYLQKEKMVQHSYDKKI